MCRVRSFVFYFIFVTFLQVYMQNEPIYMYYPRPVFFFFFLLRCFNHEAKSPHMINPHENKNSLHIYSKSSSTKVHLKMHLFLQMSHYHMHNFISLNSFLSSLARNTINVISVSSLIQTPVFSIQKRGYFHSSMVYLVFQSGLLCQIDAHWFSNWTGFFVAGTCE